MSPTKLLDWMNNYITIRDFMTITGHDIYTIKSFCNAGLPVYTFNIEALDHMSRFDSYFYLNIAEVLTWMSNQTIEHKGNLPQTFKSIYERKYE